jgi:glyoxylase-like metal-dependent hydrolase (beta-lactamase superfamily II)
MKKSRLQVLLMVCGALGIMFLSSSGFAQQQDYSKVQIQTIPLRDGVAMLMGAGGNLGVSYGEDGVFLIDDQFAPLTDKIKAAISKLDKKPVRFVINTHWHLDHVGGNENFGKAGAVIVAHENVRKRMSVDQFMKAFNTKIPASPKVALPVITFTQDITFHLNGDELEVFHLKNAHTDGDAVVWFRKANVLHTGDLYFEGLYPFIDIESGGSIDGMIAAVTSLLPLIDENTKVIPGHGPLSNKAELTTYLETLTIIRDRINKLVQEGKSREEVVAAKPTADFDAKLGKGFLTPEQFVSIVYMDLSRP